MELVSMSEKQYHISLGRAYNRGRVEALEGLCRAVKRDSRYAYRLSSDSL